MLMGLNNDLADCFLPWEFHPIHPQDRVDGPRGEEDEGMGPSTVEQGVQAVDGPGHLAFFDLETVSILSTTSPYLFLNNSFYVQYH